MPKRIGNYQIIQTLGDGLTCKVKLAFDLTNSQKVAIKIIKPDLPQKIQQGIENEIQALQLLEEHPNIIKLLYAGRDDYVNEEKQKSKNVYFMVLELAKGGELFDFLAISGKFSEPMARYFFLQMMNGLEFSHRNKVCHRDLKPENLLLDQDYNLKIADFGFARDLSGNVGDGRLSTRCGTVPYMAPEIHQSKDYSGQSIDLFAAGIILFVMVAQHQPFSKATEDDNFYKCFYKNRSDIFWKTMLQRHGNQQAFSPEIMDLLNCMLQVDPVHRPSIYELIAHDWCKGPTPSKEEIIKEFQQRHAQVRDELAAQKKEKVQQKEDYIKNEIYRNTNFSEEMLFQPQKQLDEYVNCYDQDTVFFSTYNPDLIEKQLILSFKADGIQDYQVSKDKYKVKFEKVGIDEQDNTEDAVQMTMRISRVNEQTYAVQFQKLNGTKIAFLKYYQQYKEYILNHFNDTPLEEQGKTEEVAGKTTTFQEEDDQIQSL